MSPHTSFHLRLFLVIAAIGVLAWPDDRVVNVATYAVEPLRAPCGWAPHLAPILAIAALLWATRDRHPTLDARSAGSNRATCPVARPVVAWGLPLAAALAAWGWALLPPATGGYALLLAALILIPLAVVTLGGSELPVASKALIQDPAPPSCASHPGHRLAGVALLAAIVMSTVWHTWTQVVLWRHFAFGHADIGLFVTELENCLPFKDVGPDRFAATRMGFHCIPMFYGLVLLYAMFRSPILLMVAASASWNLAAWPFARMARMRCGSATAGLAIGLAWLALPSVSRVPYANTYGFQSIDLAVPWLAWAPCLWFAGRRRLSHACLVGAMLCEETVCGVALGWGLYLALVEKRRREGAVVALAAVGYLLLCTCIVIPAFDVGGRYSRLDLFGELNAATLIERLTRAKAGWYLATLLAPMAAGLWRRRGLILAAAPTLLLVLLLNNADYLSIKYWHQGSILPVLFAAAVLGATTRGPDRGADRGVGGGGSASDPADEQDRPAARHADVRPMTSVRIPCAALLVAALLAHQWLGFSPLAHAFRPMSADATLAVVDPREAVVEMVIEHFDPSATHVIATERLAAHFTRYRTVRSTPNVDFASLPPGAFIMIVDRTDTHDRVISGGGLDALLDAARRNGFTTWRDQGAITILSQAER